MPWQCKLVDPAELRQKGEPFKPGDMFYATDVINDPDIFKYYEKHELSPEYLKTHYGKRPPIVVVLPGNIHWMVDSRFGDGPDKPKKEHGWVIIGEAPNITASPSINYVGNYHGWLRNGVLSDDVEGRKF